MGMGFLTVGGNTIGKVGFFTVIGKVVCSIIFEFISLCSSSAYRSVKLFLVILD